jgi:hypothetical protein
MELHHKDSRKNGGGNEKDNLLTLWPTDHASKDTSRRTGYVVLEVLNE